MKNNLTRAKTLLEQNENLTCIICKGETIYTSDKRGIKPLLEWINEEKSFVGFSAADKVVGKAAAFLYVILGIEEIYAPVMSEGAAAVFAQYRIPATYAILTKAIINRAGTGMCPMEQTVLDITNPQEALKALREKAKSMRI